MSNLKKEIGVIVNDLGIYHKGLEVAVGHNNIKDVVRYLNNMKAELGYALTAIMPLEQQVGKTEVVKEGIEKDIADHRSKVHELKRKLKELKYHPVLEDGSSSKL